MRLDWDLGEAREENISKLPPSPRSFPSKFNVRREEDPLRRKEIILFFNNIYYC